VGAGALERPNKTLQNLYKKPPAGARPTGVLYINLAMSYFIRRILATHPFGAAFGCSKSLLAILFRCPWGAHGIGHVDVQEALMPWAQERWNGQIGHCKIYIKKPQ